MRQCEFNVNDVRIYVNESDSFPEVVRKMGFDPNKGNTKKNIERFIRRNNISVDHFSGIKRIKETNLRYEKENLINLINKNNTLKDVLLDLNLLPEQSNYKTLKKYLKKYEINFSKYSIIINNNYKDDALLKEVISESTTLSEVLNKLKLPTQGNNYKTIKKYIKLYNIDISHFKRNDITKPFNIRKDINYYLREDFECSTSHLKKRLYEEGLKLHKCEICGQDENWYGKKMSLILDHINGKNNDNRLENLRIVCPNCNATLDTHCRGFKGLIDKKNRKGYNSRINSRKVERPNLEIILNDVKILGYLGTGRKYGVSDNAIRKWIKCYETDLNQSK